MKIIKLIPKCCALAIFSALPAHAAPYLVYRVAVAKDISYWEENLIKNTRKAGKLKQALSAYVIQNPSDTSQVSVYFDSNKKTFSLGRVGMDMEFVDDYGTDPFFPVQKVTRTFYNDGKGKSFTFWSGAMQSDGEVMLTETRKLYKIGNEPVFTFTKSADMQTLTGAISSLNMGNGTKYNAPATISGDGFRYSTNPYHAIYRYNTVATAGAPLGIQEEAGGRHVAEERKISFTFQASLTKLVNTNTNLLDDRGLAVSFGTDRYAILKMFADLKRQKLVFTP